MSEIKTNIEIIGGSIKYKSNITVSINTLDSNLLKNQSLYKTDIKIFSDPSKIINTTLELDNTSMTFDLVDTTKLNQTTLYFSKFFNTNFEDSIFWDLLGQATTEQINSSHLSTALSPYIKASSISPVLENISTNISNIWLDLNNHIANNNIHLTLGEKMFLSTLMSGDGGGEAFCYLELDENGNVVVKDRLKLIVNNRLEAQAIAGLALEVPSVAPNTEYTKDGEWYIYVGELGEGSDTPPSGGGGTSVVWGDGEEDSYWGLNVAGETKIVSLHGHKHQFTDITGTDHLATQDDINILQGNIDTVSTRVGVIEGDYLSKSKGGEVTADVTISAALKMNTLYLPSSSSLPSEWNMYVGELGSGSDTPESGGGLDIDALWVELGSNVEEKVIDASHIPDLSGTYLPKSGGTITGDLSLNQYLRINAWSGYGSGSANAWYDGNAKRLLWANVVDMGIGSYLAIHSGNIGSYTAGNANALGSISAEKYLYGFFGAYDANTQYDLTYRGIAQGVNLPSSAQYGSLLTLPYRKPQGNTYPDFAAQIFLPNGDDATPDLFFRTSLSDSWRRWRRVIAENENGNVLIGTTTDNGAKLQVTGDITTTKLSIDASYGVNPISQGIVINTTNSADDYGWNPGIGFHIPGVTYATIKLTNDSLFRFFNSSLSGYLGIVTAEIYAYSNIYATGNITTEGDLVMKNLYLPDANGNNSGWRLYIGQL